MSDYHAWQDEIDWRPVAPGTFVAPAPRPVDPPPTLWQPSPSGVGDVWRPTPAVVEQSTPVARAQAFLIRQLLLAVIWLVLAVAAGLAAWQFAGLGGGLSALFGLAVFGGCAAASFIALDRAERGDSAIGLEKHRINQAASLERMRMEQDYTLKRMALEQFLERMEERL